MAEATKDLEDILSSSKSPRDVDMPHMYHRSFFTMTSGHIGVTSMDAEPVDEIFIILGCLMPIILRPDQESNSYRVVGPTYVDGFMDGEALRGPLTDGSQIQLWAEAGWQGVYKYSNAKIEQIVQEDPRFGPLPEEWERVEARRSSLDVMQLVRSRNVETGEVLNGGLRLLSDALRAHGVELETLRLL